MKKIPQVRQVCIKMKDFAYRATSVFRILTQGASSTLCIWSFIFETNLDLAFQNINF